MAIQGLAESKSNWINFLSDLQERLYEVEDVWLEKLQVVRSTRQSTPPAPRQAAAAKEAEPLKLTLTGRLLDRNNPVSKVSNDSRARVETLLKSFKDSNFILDVQDERFDTSQPGILRFDFTLLVNPRNPL